MGPFNFNPNNPLFSKMGGFNNFVNQFNTFQQMFNQNAQMTPQQIIQQKIQNGEITQEQFNQVAQMASQLIGGNNGGR